jgi:hypothetical protein
MPHSNLVGESAHITFLPWTTRAGLESAMDNWIFLPFTRQVTGGVI